MALNWAMLEAGNPVPLPGERFLSKFENADVSVLASPNGELPALKRTGVIHVSDQRLVFVEPFPRPPNTNAPTQLELNSLSVPLVHILQSEFKQPYFSANYLSILVHPVTGGGLPGRTTVEIRFLDQGLFGFVEMLDKLRNRAIAQRREVREANTLPTYVAPENPSVLAETVPQTTATVPPPDQDLPPAYDG